MKEQTVLDYIEFRLTSPTSNSRCELFISADGETEKLASGFLKTFLSQLRAAQEQYAGTSQSSIRLKGPIYNSSWFTKGTIQRFVQFVSTPELLERVKTVEDELIQLEQVRSIQANSLGQIKDAPFISSCSVLKSEISPALQSEQYQNDTINSAAEASKRQLLQAMDIRLHSLRQEQQMVFCRATAAGFDAEHFQCLMAFSDFFGAERLRSACTCFMDISRDRQWEVVKPIEVGSLDTSFHSNLPVPSANGETAVAVVSLPTASSRNDIHEHQSARGFVSDTGIPFPKPTTKSPRENIVHTSPHSCSELPGNVVKSLPQRTSPKRRSISPLKKVQVGRFGSRRSGSIVVRSINYFSCHERPARDSQNNDESSCSDSDDYSKRSHALVPNSRVVASPMPRKRLSVKAAINIFEGKQSKDTGSVPLKQRNSEQESAMGFLANPNVSSSAEHITVAALPCDSDESSHITSISDLPHRFGSVEMNRYHSSNELFSPAKTDLQLVGGSSPISSDPCSTITSITSMEKSTLSGQYSPSVSPSMLQSNRKSYEQNSPISSNMKKIGGAESAGSTSSEWETSRCSWVVPSDANIQALANMVNHPAFNEDFCGKHEGRFYEQYRKMRDAKLMEEQKSKKAEREAKLKLMEKTLELRKAEMEARTAKLSKENNGTEVRAAKLLALKANLSKMQNLDEEAVKEQVKECAPNLRTKDFTASDNTPPSPPLTPRVAKEQAVAPKLRGKKSTSSTATSRSSGRLPSVSPKSSARGVAGRSRPSENPLSYSVPCLSDLKKENTKPAPVKSSSSARTNSKTRGTNKLSNLQSNGSAAVQNNQTKRSGTIVKKKGSHNRQISAGNEDIVTSATDEETLLLAIKDEKEARLEAPFPTKIRRSAVAPIQDVKPFLRKGSGIGPGAGPGVIKSKVFTNTDAGTKSSDDDAPATPLKSSDEDTLMQSNTDKSDSDNVVEEITMTNSSIQRTQETEENGLGADIDMIVDADVTHHSDDGLFVMSETDKLDVPLMNDDDMPESERCCHTISFPIDIGTHEFYGVSSLMENRFDPVITEKTICSQDGEGTSSLLSNILAASNDQFSTSDNSTTDCAPHFIPDELSMPKFTTVADDDERTLKNISSFIQDHSGRSCGSAARIVESPLLSQHVARNDLSTGQSVSESRPQSKPSSLSQKPVVVVVPPKEPPAKGLRRLLNFARKTRAAPEIIIADCLSASATSEGDDDFEESKRADRRHRNIESSSLSGDHGSSQDKSAQSLRSSIPIPSSNFKAREDHTSGSTRLKTPRSFFFLSTFRSRGGEAKLR